MADVTCWKNDVGGAAAKIDVARAVRTTDGPTAVRGAVATAPDVRSVRSAVEPLSTDKGLALRRSAPRTGLNERDAAGP